MAPAGVGPYGPSMRAAATALLLLVFASPAQAHAHAFWGPHPVDGEGGWHDGRELHEHPLPRELAAAFADAGGYQVFLGDPEAYGWPGGVWDFVGPHPLGGGLDAYCALTGRHTHAFAPEGAYRVERDGAHRYQGALSGRWRSLRPRRLRPPRPIVAPAQGGPPPIALFPCLTTASCLPHVGRRGVRAPHVRPRTRARRRRAAGGGPTPGRPAGAPVPHRPRPGVMRPNRRPRRGRGTRAPRRGAPSQGATVPRRR